MKDKKISLETMRHSCAHLMATAVEMIYPKTRFGIGPAIEEGFYSCANVHLANISYRLGRTIDFDPVKQEIVGDPEASRMLTRKYRQPFKVPDV